jgi:hypothetical protein
MQRKASKKSRAANAAEKRFMDYTKHSRCICCGNSPCYVHHCWGSSERKKFEGESVLIGHWAVLPLCANCDEMITKGSARVFETIYAPQIDLWWAHYSKYDGSPAPGNVLGAMKLILSGVRT